VSIWWGGSILGFFIKSSRSASSSDQLMSWRFPSTLLEIWIYYLKGAITLLWQTIPNPNNRGEAFLCSRIWYLILMAISIHFTPLHSPTISISEFDELRSQCQSNIVSLGCQKGSILFECEEPIIIIQIISSNWSRDCNSIVRDQIYSNNQEWNAGDPKKSSTLFALIRPGHGFVSENSQSIEGQLRWNLAKAIKIIVLSFR
jgi:hypothetical protein